MTPDTGTRIARDSTNPDAIPLTDLSIAIGYHNGRFAWSPAQFARFEKAGIRTARIDVIGTDYEECGIVDCERGDVSPATAAKWAKVRHALGHRAVIYCNRSTLEEVHKACRARGLEFPRDYTIWLATLDGTRRVGDMNGVVAIQHDTIRTSHGEYDESEVFDPTWHPTAHRPHAAEVMDTADDTPPGPSMPDPEPTPASTPPASGAVSPQGFAWLPGVVVAQNGTVTRVESPDNGETWQRIPDQD